MIPKLEHYNIRTGDLEKTVHFYTKVLGLQDGPFPADRRLGAWLYDVSGKAVVHVIAVDPENAVEAYERVKSFRGEMAGTFEDFAFGGRTGAIDHIAFECTDYEDVVAKFRVFGIAYHPNDIPSMNFRQIFVKDPNDVTIELNFR